MIKILMTLIVGIILLILIFFYFFPIIKICGDSMHPTLKDGEFYLGRRVFNKNTCRRGEIYVYKPPVSTTKEKHEFVVKRLENIRYRTNGITYFFVGDNSEVSYDSRYYGYVDSSNVVAHIILRKEV